MFRKILSAGKSAIRPVARKARQFLHSEISPVHIDLEKFRDEMRYRDGLIQLELRRENRSVSFDGAGFSVYSQFDEDGIIQHLLKHVPIENDLFIEFGVEDYRQSNTRFLLMKDNWKGVICDIDDSAKEFLEATETYFWRTIDVLKSFVTKDNVNDLFRHYAGDIGLLSVDIDGMDYWVFEALDVVSPRILILEYTANFGPDVRISAPYSPEFDHRKHHWSALCFGASLRAMAELAQRKGYTLVAGSKGHNAFFVRNDVLGSLVPVNVEDVYREARYRFYRDKEQQVQVANDVQERRRVMGDAIVYSFDLGREETVAEVFGLA